MKQIRFKFSLLGLVMLAAICGCKQTEIRSFQSPFELPLVFSSQGVGELPEKWWQSFEDPNLNTVVETALDQNFTIRSAWNRLSQAEQIANQTGAPLYPSVSYLGGASRNRREISGQKEYTSDYAAGLIASYELDLWGRIRSIHQAAILDAEAAQEDVMAAAVTLSATVSKVWYRLAEAMQQKSLIEMQIETNTKILKVIQTKFRKSQVSAADVFSQEQLVQASKSRIIKIHEQIEVLQNQLSVLTGKVPGPWWSDQSIDFAMPNQFPVIDIPAVIIQRRPDVISAYRNVQAADQIVAAAIADQYPSVSISSRIDTGGSSASDLFNDWFANIAGNFIGPLFDAGLRKSEVKRRQAALSQAFNNYNQTVLIALQETENAISQELYQRQFLESLQKQYDLARKVYERTYQGYLKGQFDYLRVLTALVSMQNLEQQVLTAKRVLIEFRIDLCRSIAGGWPLQKPSNADTVLTASCENEK